MFGGLEIAVWSLLIIASITDLLWGKIYNALTFPFLFAGIVVRFYLGGTLSAGQALLSVAFAFAIFFPLYFLKAFAAGDVKLLMAVGAWIDTNTTWKLALLSILFGGLVGLILIVKKKGAVGASSSVLDHLDATSAKKSYRMPYAPAFFCAFVFLQILELKGWSVF